MAIEAGWDPGTGPSWGEDPDPPAFVPPDAATLAEWARIDAALPEPEDPWDGWPEDPGLLVFRPQDDESHLDDPDTEPEPDAKPGWAVPGVSEAPSAAEGGVSAESQALLDEVAAAVTGQRQASARVYRLLTALRRSDVLDETHYKKLSSLLEDHVRLDPRTVNLLERQAAALHETVTPTGATTPAELPATAAAVDDGEIGEGHVEVIRTTMERLRKVPDLDPAVLDTAEEQLAGLAATRSPRQLVAAAKVIADRLDPDGALPKDDDPAGNELHYTKRRNGQLTAKLILREPAAAALFDDAVRAATPAPPSAVVADPETGLPPVTDDHRRVGQDPHDEARHTKPNRQAYGLLDLISASHRAGLDHPEAEQHPGSPTASMPLPDLEPDGDTTAWPTEPTPESESESEPRDAEADAPPSETTAPPGDTEQHAADDIDPAFEPGLAAADDTADAEDTDANAEDTDAEDTDTEDADEVTADEPFLFGSSASDPTGAESDPPDPAPPPPWSPPEPGTMTLPGRERVTLTVTLDYETLRQQLIDTSTALALLGDSTWLRPDTARRLACDADIIPIVLGSKGEVLDVGRKARTVPTATARAVIHRDRHCAFPGCRRRARTTEIHHINHWANHGDTEPDNLVCLCRYHHDLVHHAGWQVQMIDHQPWFTPPTWLDPTRTPRHNRPWQLVTSSGADGGCRRACS